MAQILIIFGSTGGNTEIVVDKVVEVLEQAGHSLKVQRGEHSKLEDCNSYDLCILAAPTYGQGDIQEHMTHIYQALKGQDLQGKKFALIGLGDYKYHRLYNIESATLFEAALKEAQAEQVSPPLRVNKSPIPLLDNKITDWAKELAAKL